MWLTDLFGSSNDKTIKIWDPRSNGYVDNVNSNSNSPVLSIAFNEDGKKLVSGCENGMFSLLAA